MQRRGFSIAGDSTGEDAVGTAGVVVAMPTTYSTRSCMFVLLSCYGNAIHYMPVDDDAIDPTNAVMPMLNPGDGPLVLAVGGATHMRLRSVTGTARVRITPLED